MVKKSFFGWGLAAALIALVLLTGCPTDSDGGGDGGSPSVTAPAVDNLPDTLPTGAVWVAGKDAAKSFIEDYDFANLMWNINNEVKKLIEDKTTGNYGSSSWNFTGDTSITGLKVSSTGSESYSGSEKVGSTMSMSDKNHTTVEVTADYQTYYSSWKLIKGSKGEFNIESSMSVKITAVDEYGDPSAGNGSSSDKAAYAYGLVVVSDDNKAAKIILSAETSESASGSFGNNVYPKPTVSCSGTLTVYGQGTTALYTLTIDKTNIEDILEYLGIY
jgi:hypothetical protein